eukprot:GHVU01084434.1.p2 GENE.GHVU01084434.1~~GHVU01084434.1.p2  ORF type:complete len:208 (+),score=46.91 GHVU01084434.1:1798-2421(+)
MAAQGSDDMEKSGIATGAPPKREEGGRAATGKGNKDGQEGRQILEDAYMCTLRYRSNIRPCADGAGTEGFWMEARVVKIVLQTGHGDPPPPSSRADIEFAGVAVGGEAKLEDSGRAGSKGSTKGLRVQVDWARLLRKGSPRQQQPAANVAANVAAAADATIGGAEEGQSRRREFEYEAQMQVVIGNGDTVAGRGWVAAAIGTMKPGE